MLIVLRRIWEFLNRQGVFRFPCDGEEEKEEEGGKWRERRLETVTV